MKHDYDIVVVGGGPCGSFTALNALKKNVSVAVFEEHHDVGIPVHCPGHISINGLRQLGLYPLPNMLAENSFSGAKFYSPQGMKFSVRFNSPITCTVNRASFDKYIKRMAEKFGVYYHFESRVEALIKENSHVKGVEVQSKDGRRKVYSKIVVDAEGVSARLAKMAGLESSRHVLKAVHAEVENVRDIEEDTVEVYLGNTYAPGFYSWLIPLKDGRAKIGLAVKEGNPMEFLKKLILRHPEASLKLRNSKILHVRFHAISLGGPVSKAFSNGFLAVGDAASQSKPTTGGGIITGLNCARIAAEVAVEALNSGDASERRLKQYQRGISKLMGLDMNAMHVMRKIIDKISDSKIEKIANFYNRMEIYKVVKNIKEIDFQGKALLKAIKDPRILAFLTYSFIISLWM